MNVVPLVDVVLVLLIIFMITAHVTDYGMDVQVPTVKNTNESNEDLPVVTISRDAKLYLNDQPVKNINTLAAEIKSRFQNNKSVFVRADRRLMYEQLANVISALKGFDVNLVTTPEDTGK